MGWTAESSQIYMVQFHKQFYDRKMHHLSLRRIDYGCKPDVIGGGCKTRLYLFTVGIERTSKLLEDMGLSVIRPKKVIYLRDLALIVNVWRSPKAIESPAVAEP